MIENSAEGRGLMAHMVRRGNWKGESVWNVNKEYRKFKKKKLIL